MSKELEKLDKVLNHNYYTFIGDILEEYEEEINDIKKDLEILEMLLSCFKSAILDATSNGYRRGDNIIADSLIDKLGLINLNELRKRIENDR